MIDIINLFKSSFVYLGKFCKKKIILETLFKDNSLYLGYIHYAYINTIIVFFHF